MILYVKKKKLTLNDTEYIEEPNEQKSDENLFLTNYVFFHRISQIS